MWWVNKIYKFIEKIGVYKTFYITFLDNYRKMIDLLYFIGNYNIFNVLTMNEQNIYLNVFTRFYKFLIDINLFF